MMNLILRDPSPSSLAELRGRAYIGDINGVKLETFKGRVKNVANAGNEVLIAAQPQGHLLSKLSTLNWGMVGTGQQFLPTIDVAIALTTSPYSASLPGKHCLVFVDGFFVNRRDPKNGRVPYYVQSIFGGPFALAGIWNAWKGHDGALVSACSILLRSVVPEEKMGYMNNEVLKSPVILAAGAEEAWLVAKDRADALALLETEGSSLIQGHTVSPAVNLVNSDAYSEILTTHIAYTDTPII